MWKRWHLVSASLSAAEGVAAIDRIINVYINGSHLARDNQTAGVQHEGNAAALRLHFDPGWDGFAKTVTFWNAAGEHPVQRILTADLLEDMTAESRVYRCPIPPEAMTEPGKLTYIVDGMAGDVRQRSVEDTLRVLAAGYAPEAGTPADPTPTRAEQLQVQVDALMGELQQGMAAAEAAKNSAGAAADSEWKAALYMQEAQDAAADAADSKAAAENAAKRAEGAVAGTVSFNGRSGHVMPQTGDYTADMVGAVNPDLLDNWYFADPINQRGQTKYTEKGYAIDRWKLESGTRLEVLSDCARLTGQYQISQYFEEPVTGKVTVSLLFKNRSGASLKILTNNGKTPVQRAESNAAAGLMSATFDAGGMTELLIGFRLSGSNTADLIAAKLELGSVQTLAHQDADGNWVLNKIPNRQQELAKCQRYQVVYEAGQLHGRAHAYAANGAYVTIALPAPLRATPSFPNGSPLSVLVGGYATDANTVKGTGATNASVNNNVLSFFLATDGGLTAAANYPINATDKFIIDANL